MSRFRRPLMLLALAAAVLIALAAPASAHVSVNPKEATKGGFTKLSFRVPNERPDASTTKLEVKLPADHPIANVSVKPLPGWTATVTRATLATPIEVHGESVTEAPSVVTWTASAGAEIKPGEFQEFDVSVGPLPEDADALMFPSVQTYSSGEVVSWIELQEEGGEEPEHPAPVLTLVDPAEGADHHDDSTDSAASVQPVSNEAAGESTSHDDDSDSGKGIAIVALVVGALGLVAGISGLALGRRA